MTELLESVCEKMRDYGTTTDPGSGRRGYTRINTRPGESLTISNVNLSSGGSEELTNAVSHKSFSHSLLFVFSGDLVPLSPTPSLQCHYVVGEHEEDIVDLYGDGLNQREIESELCYEITGTITQFLR